MEKRIKSMVVFGLVLFYMLMSAFELRATASTLDIKVSGQEQHLRLIVKDAQNWPHWSIGVLKKVIEKRIKLLDKKDFDQRRLIYNNEILNEKLTLSDYNVPLTEANISIFVTEPLSNKVLLILLPTNDIKLLDNFDYSWPPTIAEVKAKIEEITGIPSYKQVLHSLDGLEFSSDTTQIKENNTTIRVVINEKALKELGPLPIRVLFVKMLYSKNIITLSAPPGKNMADFTIKQIKEMIKRATGIPVDKQWLTFNDGISTVFLNIDDGKTMVKDCDIQNESTLELTDIRRNVKKGAWGAHGGRTIAGAAVALVSLAALYKAIQWWKARSSKKQPVQQISTLSKQDRKYIVGKLVHYFTTMNQSEQNEAIALLLKPYDAATRKSLLAEARAQVAMRKSL